MRLQIASDLHLEHLEWKFPAFRGVEPVGADVLVLAGDIAKGSRVLDLFGDWPCPVVYVPGNHEFYGGEVAAVLADLQQRAGDFPNVKILAPGVWEHDSVRFIGCTLWTDYEVFGAERVAAAMAICAEKIVDHSSIRCPGDTPFLPADALALHRAQRQWLGDRLAEPCAGRTVVITHHGPHRNSIAPHYADDLTSAAFASDLEECLGIADLHIHGHTHESFDYTVGQTRVVANPMGYCRGIKAASTPSELWRENAAFDCRLVVEV
ncbi:metallophosphoesterase [Azonexus sp. IMCC34842]|uniref:metallophosphoesterase n=1 Tax=Azonexus sp. IMCC34842 TaxID=3420950 RepID=UPI003D0C7766